MTQQSPLLFLNISGRIDLMTPLFLGINLLLSRPIIFSKMRRGVYLE
jgi:hypothetical protein